VRGQRRTPALSTPGKDPVSIVQEAGWAPGPVWTGAENLAPPGFDPRTVTARSQSLYRLSYPAHEYNMLYIYIYLTAIGLTPGGSSTAHIYTQTIHRIQRTEHKYRIDKNPVAASEPLSLSNSVKKIKTKVFQNPTNSQDKTFRDLVSTENVHHAR
jgi:hypothetical protein